MFQSSCNCRRVRDSAAGNLICKTFLNVRKQRLRDLIRYQWQKILEMKRLETSELEATSGKEGVGAAWFFVVCLGYFVM